MKAKEVIDWTLWPSVPQAKRQKKLFLASTLTEAQAATLTAKGWDLVDIRLLPAETDEERGAGLKACLEGIRLGSIVATDGVAKYIELEAKIYGLLSQKEQVTTKQLDAATLQELLSVGAEWTSTNTQAKPSSKKSKDRVKDPVGKES